MDSPSSFEHQEPIEADFKILAAEVQRSQDATTENRVQGVEALKNAIRSFPTLNKNEQSGVIGPTANATVVPAPASDSSPLPAYAQSVAPEVKREIEHLVDVAMSKGISEAVTESEKSPDFVRDAFHDALAGKLYPELQQRGLIK